MDYLTEAFADLEERIDNVSAIGDVNEDLVKIAIGNLEIIKADLELTGRNQGILKKVERQLATYQDVARIPQLTTKFPIIREQMIVLMIGALEVFVADIYRLIAEEDPDYFIWSDSKEKITFEPSILRDGFTLGDVVVGHLKNKGYSFQDLKSLIDSFRVYCGVEVPLTRSNRDILIFGAASRHIIVHNRSTIDSGFMKQIRDTRYASPLFAKGNPLLITDEFVRVLAETIKDFCGYIVSSLQQRDD
jgi:hypothetical protein